MGFFIRKSIKVGPVRLNLSKSGLGASAGIKGLRVSTGPRGTELNAGRKGIYYRQQLSSPQSWKKSNLGISTALIVVGIIAVFGILALVFLVVLGLLVNHR